MSQDNLDAGFATSSEAGPDTGHDFLTLAVRVRGRQCLVIGGGDAGGGRKARRLQAHGAHVTVVAPEVGRVVAGLAAAGKLTWERRAFSEDDLTGQWLVVAATDNHPLNEALVTQARARGILASLASKGREGDVLFTATTKHGPSTIAVHSQGTGVRRTIALRDRLAGFLAGLPDELAPADLPASVAHSGGMVYLIGAGPGAADLLTLRALRALQRCHVLIVDRILGPQFLSELDLDVRKVEVWHLPGGTNSPARQAQINERLVAEAQAGRRVGRLKAGDPLVFGRGGEEADACDAAGVRWEFVPGLSASVALLTNAGYPSTDRGRGRSFAVVSARLAGGAHNERFPKADSLVVLMGFRVLEQVRQRMYDDGWSPQTPAVLIERGTAIWERRVAAPLCQVLEEATKLGCDSPVILAAGQAAAQCYRSPQRPVVVFTGEVIGPWRDLGDCLHWPAGRLDQVPSGAVLPPHEVVAFVHPTDVQRWAAHWGALALAPQVHVWVADDATAAAVEEAWPSVTPHRAVWLPEDGVR